MFGKVSAGLAAIVGTIVLGTTIAPPSASGAGGNLNVKFVGLKNAQGKICMNLFSGPSGFPRGDGSNLAGKKCVSAGNGATVSFSNLKPGTYAVSALHDMNSDGKMNQNFLGIPKEGFGFSNNPQVRMKAPSFGEAQFKVSGGANTVQIQMRYL
jgi:uncharacterized protein (DUF2141 family)